MSFGQLFVLSNGGDGQPVLKVLTAPHTERGSAQIIGRQAVYAPEWGGPKQVLFLHDGGWLELWDKELREGFE